MTPGTRYNHLSSINITYEFSDTSNTHDHIKITPWEREINHIATGRALSLGGDYSHMVMVSTLDGEVDEEVQPGEETTDRCSHGAAAALEMAMESMEMAPGALPRPDGVPEQRFCPPKLVVDGGGAAELFVEYDRIF